MNTNRIRTTAQMLLVTLTLVSPLIVASEHSPDFATLYEQHSQSVVTVHTANLEISRGNPQTSRGVGSGVLIEEDQILTAAHVVDNAQRISVEFVDGERIDASVIASLKSSDVALLKLNKSPANPRIAKLGNSTDARIGSNVFIIGAPFGIAQTLSVGILSGRIDRGLMAGGTPIEFLQTDTAINTGNSGGPMFNTDGEVIGIVSFILTKSGGFDGIGFATSINSAKEALLSSSGVLAGFEGVMLDETMARTLNFPSPGMLVQRVNEGSAVSKAGLKAGRIPANIAGQSLLLGGDLIIEINGLVCRTPHDFELLQTATVELEEDQVYSIKVFRNGEITELVAGEFPATATLF